MIIKKMTRVKTLDFLCISQVGMVEISSIFINIGNSSDNNFTNFPRERYELFFSFLRKGVKPKFILSSYFNNKQLIRYIIWKKNRFLDREIKP
jgi:hypothetical protein